MKSAEELKQIFRTGWSDANVVAHRVERFIEGEFGFEPSRRAWREALQQATAGNMRRRAIDMGTGPGTIAQFWAELGYDVTGLDFSSAMLAAARRVAQHRGLTMHFMEADVEKPPYPDESFDLVSSRAVLFTLPHPGYTLARWTRLLKANGLLVLIGENSPTDPEKLRRQFHPPKNWHPSQDYLQALKQLPFREHTDAMLRVVMEAVGLINIHAVPVQAIIDARTEHEALRPHYGVLQGEPYILVGQRPA